MKIHRLNLQGAQKRKNLKMLKCKNEAPKLLKTKDQAWVRLPKRTANEPIGGPNEAIFSAQQCTLVSRRKEPAEAGGEPSQSCRLSGNMNDGFDHAVAPRGNHLERRLGFFEGEMMGDEWIEADRASRH